MKIDILHLVHSLSPQGINSKDNDFEANELGVLITPKGGGRSFSRRVRFVPWANIKACDLAEDPVKQEIVARGAEGLFEPIIPAEVTAQIAPTTPDTTPADVIKFVKNEKTGMIEEKRMPHRSVEHRPESPETPQSAFAKLRDAKAEPAPE